MYNNYITIIKLACNYLCHNNYNIKPHPSWNHDSGFVLLTTYILWFHIDATRLWFLYITTCKIIKRLFYL